MKIRRNQARRQPMRYETKTQEEHTRRGYQWLSLSVSVVALVVSIASAWALQCRPADIGAEMGSIVLLPMAEQRFLCAIPITLRNDGAQLGVVSDFQATVLAPGLHDTRLVATGTYSTEALLQSWWRGRPEDAILTVASPTLSVAPHAAREVGMMFSAFSRLKTGQLSPGRYRIDVRFNGRRQQINVTRCYALGPDVLAALMRDSSVVVQPTPCAGNGA